MKSITIDGKKNLQHDELDGEIVFCVSMIKISPDTSGDYYDTYREDPEILNSTSVEELYEKMAQEVTNHSIYGEKSEGTDRYTHINSKKMLLCDCYEIEFGPIYIEIEPYNEERMKCTKAYQERGIKMELDRKARKIAQELKVAQQEKEDALRRFEAEKKEFLRLSKKFAPKTPESPILEN